MSYSNVKPAQGKLGVMVVGCGAVTTTFMAGVLMARKGLAKPVGSMTQYDKIRVGQGKTKSIFAIRTSYLSPTSTISYSAHGTYIRPMPTRLLSMPKCSRSAI